MDFNRVFCARSSSDLIVQSCVLSILGGAPSVRVPFINAGCFVECTKTGLNGACPFL